MSPVWDLGRDDLLRGKLVEDPTFYCVEIKKSVMGMDSGKSGEKAALWKLDGVILNEGPYKDVPVSWNFSEKAKGMSVRFLEACGATIQETGVRVNTDAVVGKRIEIFIANRTWENRIMNDAKDFRPCAHETIPQMNSNNGQ